VRRSEHALPTLTPDALSLDSVLKVALLALLASGNLVLPTPEAARVQTSDLIKAVGGLPDRLLLSNVPGSVVNDETIQVGVGGDGSVRTVTAEQRLRLGGTGDYAIRERGPARAATSLSDEPAPLTRKGAVVWMGFSPGHRDLGARLALDPRIEAEHLPLRVEVGFKDSSGKTSIVDGGRVPGAGTVTVTLTNATNQPAELPTGSDVPAAALAASLDKALAVARHPSAARLPSTDTVLPASLPVSGLARVTGSQAVPLQVRGGLIFSGTTATVSGPAITPTGSFSGVLGGVNGTTSVTFTAAVAGAGTLALDLTAVNALNPTELAPPRHLASWQAWAAGAPPRAERKAALDLLVEVAATGARASSYSPYLGADLRGTGSATFTYAFAPLQKAAVVRPETKVNWLAISLGGLLLLVLSGGGVLLWRRS
jgi:hypothetical protein